MHLLSSSGGPRVPSDEDSVWNQVWVTLALFLAAASASACGNAMRVSGGRDGGANDDARTEARSEPADLPTQSDSGQAAEATPGPRCAKQVLDSLLIPVRGTVRGPRVDAESCDNGLGTFFIGPQEPNLISYVEDFFTSDWLDSALPYGADNPGFFGFLLRAPADALSADLSGGIGVGAAAVGTYDSLTNCGGLDFKVTLPTPPDVVCSYDVGPCDPGCEPGGGEMMLCVPAPVTVLYQARSAASCGANQAPPAGNWQLAVTSVSPLAAPSGYLNFQTHGHLTATLVNLADASDSVVLNLDF